jgi:hypothetical protein
MKTGFSTATTDILEVLVWRRMTERNPWAPRQEPSLELKLEDEICHGCGKPGERSTMHRMNGQLRCADCARKAAAAAPPAALPVGSRPLGPPIHRFAPPSPRDEVTAPLSASTFLTAAVGGAIGALVGAALWATIAIVSGREFGYTAILLGVLAGVGVNSGSGVERQRSLQLLASGLAILGVVATSYIAFAYTVVGVAHDRGVELGYFGKTVTSRFPTVFIDSFGMFDALWMVLAVAAAYRMTRQSAT